MDAEPHAREWRLHRKRHGLDFAPDGSAWAVVSTPSYPSVGECNPSAVRWGGLRVDPDLVGLVPDRACPAHIGIGYRGCGDLWTLPVSAVLGTRLAWHPHRPLVAGFTVRARRICPWVADYRARTVTVHERVRAATSLTELGAGRRHPPLAWCGDTRLALLIPRSPPAPPPVAPSPNGRPGVYEATGPGFIAFAPEAADLEQLAGACLAVLDVEHGDLTTLTAPLLARSLIPSPTGRFLVLDRADAGGDGTDSDGLCWANVVMDVGSPGRSRPAPPGARWASGGVDVLAWRSPALAGSRIQLRAPGAEGHELLIEHEPAETVAWWPVWRGDAPAVLSDHGGALRLTTPQGTRNLPLPGRPVRFGRTARSASAEDLHRLVLDCSDAEGRVGLAVVDLDEPAAGVAWVSAAQGSPREVWATDHGDTPELVVHRGDALYRYTLTKDRLEPPRTLDPAVPSALAVPRAPVTTPPPASRSFTVPTGFGGAALTLFPAEARDSPGPLLLWIGEFRTGQTATDRAPTMLAATGYPVAALDLPLHWPSDATVQMLHGQVVDTVRGALRTFTEHCGDQGDGSVVVAGHSFGATLALYALAHVPEVAGAIAHSGCYNRTHTATGFQHEQRSYWTVPAIYHAFSALHFADHLDRPVLIVHGAEDINPATPPEQAIDLYRGIVATGGRARLVLLPHEGHNFRHLETLQALIQEHRAWLNQLARAPARC